MKIYISVFFGKTVKKSKFHYNLTTITSTLHADRYTFVIILAQFFLELEMFQTEVVEKTKTHILC